MNTPWYVHLFEFLANLMTKAKLDTLTTDPNAIIVGGSTIMDLPTFGSPVGPPAGLKESRDLAHAHPELVRRYAALKADFETRTGQQLFETCTWRSSGRQQDLYRQGRRGIAGERTVTQIDGITKRSRHMVYPAEAVDVCVDSDRGPGKHAVWDKAAYMALGPLADEHGLIWGGNWHLDDYPHLELPAGVA